MTERMFAPLKLPLVQRLKEWRQNLRERRRVILEESRKRQDQQKAEWRAKNRLRPFVRGTGMILPISGDLVVRSYVNGVAVLGSQVVVSTSSKSHLITCASPEEAVEVRKNIVDDGGFLYQSGGY